MQRFWKWIRGHLWIHHTQKRIPYIPRHDVTVVVAGNYRQFTQWCFKNQLHPSSRQLLYIPVGEAGYKLLGRSGGIKEVVYTGTWRTRQDIKELTAELDRAMYRDKAVWDYEITDREDPF